MRLKDATGNFRCVQPEISCLCLSSIHFVAHRVPVLRTHAAHALIPHSPLARAHHRLFRILSFLQKSHTGAHLLSCQLFSVLSHAKYKPARQHPMPTSSFKVSLGIIAHRSMPYARICPGLSPAWDSNPQKKADSTVSDACICYYPPIGYKGKAYP